MVRWLDTGENVLRQLQIIQIQHMYVTSSQKIKKKNFSGLPFLRHFLLKKSDFPGIFKNILTEFCCTIFPVHKGNLLSASHKVHASMLYHNIGQCEMRSFYSGVAEDSDLLGCSAVSLGERLVHLSLVDEGTVFLQSIMNHSLSDTVLHPRRPESSTLVKCVLCVF
jgi:hypothetical protein